MSDRHTPLLPVGPSDSTNRRGPARLEIVAIALASCAVLGVLILTGVFANVNASLEKRIDSVETSYINLFLRMSALDRSAVDLTVKSFQNLGGNFAVSITSVDPHLTGVNVSGVMLNQNATAQSDVKFTVTVGNTSKDLSIPSIYSSYAAKFELYLPDVATDQTKSAKFLFQSANVSYRVQ